MQTVALIQARMTSTRLPGKVLADLAGLPLLQRMLARVARAKRLDGVVVATTDNATDDPVAALCSSLGVQVFRGSEADVLGRMLAAAEMVAAKVAVRLTADCPMIDPDVIDQCLVLREQKGVDYASNVNRRTYPDGLDVECFTIEALRRADAEAVAPKAREHVTPYMRGIFPDLPQGHFSRADLTFAADFGFLRWTVDHAEDLERVREFFTALAEPFTWLDALSWATRHPHLLASNPR